MDVMIIKKNKIKKMRLIASFLIITLSIILLVYAIIIDEPIVILVFFILIAKIIDLIFNLYRIRRKNIDFNFKTGRT
jgi:hypothetical protein